MDKFTLLREENVLLELERLITKIFGKDRNPENIVRRTCVVCYKGPENEGLDVMDVRQVRGVRMVLGHDLQTLSVELEGGITIKVPVNNISEIPQAFQLEAGQFIDSILSDDEGWVMCQVEGLKVKKGVKPFSFQVSLPVNAKMKIL